MKSIVRFFSIIIVGLAVFLGALLIFNGISAHETGKQPAAEQAQKSVRQPVSRESLFEKKEGSAL